MGSVFRITHAETPTIEAMTEDRGDAVAEYVRVLIREWLAKGEGDQKQLAARAGVSSSLISQVKNGKHGVDMRSLPGFAKVFHFGTVDGLRAAAYRWWLSQGEAAMQLWQEAAVKEAIADVRELMPHVSEAQLRTIVASLDDIPRFRGRDKQAWIDTLLTELKTEHRIAAQATATKNAAARDKRARKSQIQGAMRAGHRRRKEAATSDEVPPASTEAPAPQVRRKLA